MDTVFFVDSIFNDPQGQYLDLVETMAARELGVKWACYMSPHLLTREILTLCKRAGLYAVELGTDATTDATLEAYGQAVPMGRCRADESDVRADGNRVRPFCHFRGTAGDTNDGPGRASITSLVSNVALSLVSRESGSIRGRLFTSVPLRNTFCGRRTRCSSPSTMFLRQWTRHGWSSR